jgi:hypothetical protein
MTMSDVDMVGEFLRGSTFRRLDQLAGYDARQTNGKRSWLRLQKFGLKKEDSGRLYVFADNEIRQVARQVMVAGSRGQVEAILANAWPRKLNSFRGVVVSAPSCRVFHNALSGVVRNITNGFFAKGRRRGTCQYHGCTHSGILHTAHIREDRPAIVGRVSRQCATASPNGGYEFPLDKIARRYLEEHRRKWSVAFLCPTHHQQQGHATKRGVKAARAFMRNLLP